MADNDVRFTITADDDASDVLDDVADNVEDTGKRTSKSWKDAEDASKKFALGLAAVAAAAVGAGYAAVKAYNESEQVTTRLTKLILNQNGATMANVQALKNQASAMQQVTTYGDDVVMMAQSQFATFDLSTESIMKLIPGFLDMTAAEKGASVGMQEMKDIAQGFGKALVGSTDALVKQGFVFTDQQKELLKTGSEMEKVTVLTEVMGKTYAGFAATLRNTFVGQLEVAKNTLGDFMELMGQAITVYIKPMIVAFNEWSDAIGGPQAMMDMLVMSLQAISPYLPIIAGAIIGALVPAFTSLAIAIWANVSALAPFMAAGAAVAALGYAMYLAWQNAPVVFWMIAGAIAGVAGGIMILLMPALIAQAAAWWATAAAVWAAYAPVIGTIAIFAAVGVSLGLLAYALYSLYVAWTTNMGGIQQITFDTWNAIVAFITESMTLMDSLIVTGLTGILGFFTDTLGTIFKMTVDIFGGIASFIVGTIAFILAVFTGAGKEKMNLAAAVMFGGVQNIGIAVMNGLIGIVESGLNRVLSVARQLASKLANIPGMETIMNKIAGMSDIALPRIAAVDTTVPGGMASFVGEDLKATLSSSMAQVKEAFAAIGGATNTGGVGSGGSGGSDSKDEDKKAAEAMKKEIEGNINAISKERSDKQNNRDQLQREMEKIDEELARERREGVKVNQALVDKRADLLRQQQADDARIKTLDKQLARAEGDLASQKRKEIAAQQEEDAQQAEFRKIDDMVAAQKLSEAEAAEQKRKMEADKKKREAEAKKNETSSSSSVYAPSSSSSTPSIAGIGAAGSLSAQGIVLLDVNGSGDKIYNIDIHDNQFYGDDEDFAKKIGDTILQTLKTSISSPAS